MSQYNKALKGAKMNYRELFDAIHKRPDMYGLDGTYTQYQIFLYGCDATTSWSLLAGFNEWLRMRLGRESNLSWSGLVKWLAFPEYRQVITESLFGDEDDSFVSERLVFPQGSSFNALSDYDNAVAVEALFRLLSEFLEMREKPRGLEKIFSQYVAWKERNAGKKG
jgi:hypothetical protein